MSYSVRYTCPTGDAFGGQLFIEGQPIPMTRSVLIESHLDRINTVTAECIAKDGLDVTPLADVAINFVLLPGHVLVESVGTDGNRRWTTEEAK